MALRNALEFTRQALAIDLDLAWAHWRGSAATSRSNRAASARRARTLVALICSVVVAASFLSAFHISSRLAQTSDSVQGFVEGHAIAHGNVLLSGWLLPLDNYYFTDTIAYAAMEWILGPQPVLLALIPALTYALFVWAGLAVCVNRAQSTAGKVESGATAALMLAPSGWIGSWNPMLMSDMHFATAVGALIALALCARLASSNLQGPGLALRCAIFTVVVSATVGSDPFSLVFAFGPAVVLLSTDVLLRGCKQNERVALLALTGATIVGALLHFFAARAGGFATQDNVVETFVSPGLLGRNASALAGGIMTLAGVGPFGTAFSFKTVALLALRALVLVVAVGAVGHATYRLFTRDRAPLLDRLLCAGVLSLLAACILSTQFGKGVNAQDPWVGGPPMRYAMPAAMFAVILGARLMLEILSTLRGKRVQSLSLDAVVALAALALAVGTLVPADGPPWIESNPPATAAHWLEARGLTSGDADYWSANLVTAMSGGALHLRSVVPHDGRVVPYRLSADIWKRSEPAQFMMWQDGTQSGMTFADVRATYSVCQVVTVAGYRIALLATDSGRRACGIAAIRTRAERPRRELPPS